MILCSFKISFSGFIGYTKYLNYLMHMTKGLEATDSISAMGTVFMFHVLWSSFLFFTKNVGKFRSVLFIWDTQKIRLTFTLFKQFYFSVKIDGELFFNMNLKWPKYGTKYSVSYAFFIVGWALFGFNANVVMSKYLEVSALSTGIIILQIGFLCSLGISQIINYSNFLGLFRSSTVPIFFHSLLFDMA